MAELLPVLQAIVSAAMTGLMWAFAKYRMKITDPTKPTPGKFDYYEAGETALIAVVISVAYTLMGNPLGLTGLDQQVPLYLGATAIIDPIIKTTVRWIQEKWRGEKAAQ